MTTSRLSSNIAIIGIAGRFPGADNVADFWENLRDAREGISFFDEQTLIEAGVAASSYNAPNYVRAWGILEGIENFDAAYFGISGREAELLDPQHRLFLEQAVHALEDAGCDPKTYDGYIGVYAGAGINSYLLQHIHNQRESLTDVDDVALFIGNDKDFVPTRASYKLGLRGPSMAISTGCSTSLVATHLACRALLSYQTDIALAGAVNIKLPQKTGYAHKLGSIYSGDGHCRAFDAAATGTIFGNGVGIVVLKRLDEALEDGDHIYAVIKGSAINNDGDGKAGYTAPSVGGEADVIAQAIEIAGIEPEQISFVESHGTGTLLGDPIEVQALKKVFPHDQRQHYCALGAVKTNVGHLDGASGIAGLIKTALALHHKTIPANLHYQNPNPDIDFVNSAFYVPTSTQPWPDKGQTRYAGVSSFGVGGTNAHVILSEAPTPRVSDPAPEQVLLVLSAKTALALQQIAANLAGFLEKNPEVNLADVAYTLQVGRTGLGQRRTLLCRNRAEAIAGLQAAQVDAQTIASANQEQENQDLENSIQTLNQEPGKTEALQKLAELWLKGHEIPFYRLYEGQTRQRLSLPLYPFQQQRYWLEASAAPKAAEAKKETKEPVQNWLYAPTWTSQPAAAQRESQVRRIVLLGEQGPFLDDLTVQLQGFGHRVVQAHRGHVFQPISGQRLSYQPEQEQLDALFKHLDYGFDQVVFCSAKSESDLELSFQKTFHELFVVARALAKTARPVQLLTISQGLFDVTGEEPLDPSAAALLGPLRVLPQEHPNITTALIDLNEPFDLNQLTHEILAPFKERTVALRGKRRWLQTLTSQTPDNTETPSLVQADETYLVTGGLGGIGLTLAHYLAERGAAKIFLLSRSPFPAPSTWPDWHLTQSTDPATTTKIQTLLAIQALGTELVIVTLDVADEQAMAQWFKHLAESGVIIKGAIHAAGSPDKGAMLSKSEAQVQSVFAAKLRGTLLLDQLLSSHQPRFVVYCSSLASHFGGMGQAAYCAVNNFLDALAVQRTTREGRFSLSLNWDSWAEVGMASQLDLPEALRAWQAERLERLGIRPAEGAGVFAQALGLSQANLLVATHDLQGRIARKNQVDSNGLGEALTKAQAQRNLYPRPALATPFVAATTALQRYLLQLWEETLGLTGLGINDDFFELGGDSLNGLNMVNHLQEALGEVVHVNTLFEAPTIAQTAELLTAQYPRAVARLTGSKDVHLVDEPETPITEVDLAELRTNMPRIHDVNVTAVEDSCDNAVFVLAPPRSGSTLLRVMLGGHPGLFAPPEPLLFSFNDMAGRKQAFAQDKFWLEGVTQAVTQACHCSVAEAEAFLAGFEDRSATTGEFFNWLQGQLGQRLLVDKTPSYAYEPETLQRIEKLFKRARYIHLIRHPYGMIRSYEEARMDLQIRGRFQKPMTQSACQIAEMVWTLCHQNIRQFLSGIPQDRQIQLSFEDLVGQPSETAERLCHFLDLPVHEAMLQPYADQKDRMSKGLHEQSRMLGDIKFHQHRSIEPSVAQTWRDTYNQDFLGEPSRTMAAILGYELIGQHDRPEPTQAEAINPSADQAGAEIMDQLDQLDPDQLRALLEQYSTK